MKGTSFQNPNIFPSSNTVYLDKNFAALRSKGLIAFGNLQDCVGAWLPNGIAVKKYGTPSSTNPAFIVVGCGEFHHPDTVNLTTQFVSIVGQGSLASSIIYDGSVDAILLLATDINISGLSITGAQAAIRCNVAFNGVFSDLLLDSGIAPFNLTGAMNGIISNCKFLGSNNNATFSGGGTGIIENSIFSGSVTSLIIFSTTNSMTFQNCIFTGNQSTLVAIETDFTGKFINCHMPSQSLTIDGRVGGGGSNYGTYENCFISGGGGSVALNRLSSGGALINCYIINGIGQIEDGAIINGCRIISRSPNIACIVADSGVSIELTNCTLRMTTGDVIGSSVGTGITNLVNTPFNIEISSSLTR